VIFENGTGRKGAEEKGSLDIKGGACYESDLQRWVESETMDAQKRESLRSTGKIGLSCAHGNGCGKSQ